jgi:hypothetical protein
MTVSISNHQEVVVPFNPTLVTPYEVAESACTLFGHVAVSGSRTEEAEIVDNQDLHDLQLAECMFPLIGYVKRFYSVDELRCIAAH